MGPLGIVVVDILSKYLLQVSASTDKHPVEAFYAHGAHPALGKGVCLGSLDWRANHSSPLRGEHLIEAGDVRAVPLPEQEAKRATLIGKVTGEVSRLLGDPGCVGAASHAEDVDASAC